MSRLVVLVALTCAVTADAPCFVYVPVRYHYRYEAKQPCI
jgi:hypothetical protein